MWRVWNCGQQRRQGITHTWKTKQQSQREGRVGGLLLPSHPRVEQWSRSPIPSYNSLHSLSPVPFPFPWTASRHDSGPHQLLTSLLILFTAWPHPSDCPDFPDRNLAALTDYDSDFSPQSHCTGPPVYTAPLVRLVPWHPPPASLPKTPVMGKAGLYEYIHSRELGQGYEDLEWNLGGTIEGLELGG